MKRELNPKSIYNFDNLPKPKLNHKAEGLEYKATNGSFIDLQMINCFFSVFVEVSHREEDFQLTGRNTVITASPIYQVWFVTVAL